MTWLGELVSIIQIIWQLIQKFRAYVNEERRIEVHAAFRTLRTAPTEEAKDEAIKTIATFLSHTQ